MYIDSANCSDENESEKAQQLINEATIYVEKIIKEFRNHYNSIKNSVISNNISDVRLNNRTVFADYESTNYDPSTFIFDIIYDRDYQIYIGDTTINPNNTESTDDDWSQCRDVSIHHELVVLYEIPRKTKFECYRNISEAKRAINNRLDLW